ncbi:hypothetical protein ES703_05144 [subsurface metagenome]
MLLGLFKQKRVQNCLVLTEDGRIVRSSLPVRKGHVLDDSTEEAWGLFSGALIPDKRTGKLFLLLNERSSIPMCLNGNLSKFKQATLSAIAAESADEALNKIQKGGIKNLLAKALSLSIISLSICICIIVIFGLISAGKLSFPGFGGGG